MHNYKNNDKTRPELQQGLSTRYGQNTEKQGTKIKAKLWLSEWESKQEIYTDLMDYIASGKGLGLGDNPGNNWS